MNLDDLKQTLTTMADDVQVQDPAARIAGVNDKLRGARRGKAVGAGVGVAAAATVLAVAVPSVFSRAPDQGSGPAERGEQVNTEESTTPERDGILATVLPTVEDHGAVFYSEPGGDTLIGEAVGEPGQTSVTLTVTPQTQDLAYVAFCWQSGVGSSDAVDFSSFVNGRPISGSECGARYGPLQPDVRLSPDPQANSRRWQHMGVTPSDPMTFKIAVPVSQRREAEEAGVQLGVGLYANTGPRIKDSGVTIPTEAVFAGHSYTLVDRKFTSFVDHQGEIDVPLPASTSPLYVVSGVRGVSSRYVVTGPNNTLNKSMVGGASEFSSPVRRGQQVATVKVRSPEDAEGQLYLLIYERID